MNIQIVKPITEFYFSKDSVEYNSVKMVVPTEVIFQPRIKQKIFVKERGENIAFVLTFYGDETKHFKFDSSTFDQTELINCADIFGFKIVTHQYASSILTGSLHEKNESYNMQCFGAISMVGGQYYLLVFGRRSTNSFEDDIVYVHGIYKVELSSNFKAKLSIS